MIEMPIQEMLAQRKYLKKDDFKNDFFVYPIVFEALNPPQKNNLFVLHPGCGRRIKASSVKPLNN